MEIYSSTKRMNGSNAPSTDRLSSLPEGVLCHILSFLPTKLSVATSILSTRWRSVWTGVPILNFDFENSPLKPEFSFPSVVHRVLLQHNAKSITTFRLRYNPDIGDGDCSNFDLETWVITAMARNVKNIDLYLSSFVTLPECLFTCKTLVDLRVHNSGKIPTDVAVRLPNLKKLHLHLYVAHSDESFPQLLSGCPLLEDLLVEEILILNGGFCRISSSTMKRLDINFQFDYDSDEPYKEGCKLEINAPALRYLQMKESCVSEFTLTEPLINLIEANIWFVNRRVESPDRYHISVLEFLDNLRNLKFLNLWISIHKFDPGAFSRFSVFDNLKRIELVGDWIWVTRFLEAARNLEVLIIYEVTKDLCVWREPIEVPECLLFHLKTIRIHRFDYAEPTDDFLSDRYKMIKYFLRNALVLERMVICSKGGVIDWKAKFKALQRISSFERSTACLLTFY